MRVGVISDTHDNARNVARMVEVLRAARVERVIHTGDITRPATLRLFGALGVPLFGVYGNNDREREPLAAAAAELGFALAWPLARGRGLTPVRAGLLVSLLPSLRELFLRLPGAGYGMLGVQLGALTPVVVLAANALWGWILGQLSMRAGAEGG